MPFTPLHMGPGMAVKAALPRHFSIVVFALAQIAIDLEVAWQIATGGYPLHSAWHTYLGAAIIACILAVLGKPASQRIKAFWNRIAAECRDADLTVDSHTTWTASVSAAFVGTFSHVLLDSLFHSDIQPFQPWSATNPLRGVVGPQTVELASIALGVLGLAWFLGKALKKRRAH